MIQKESLSGGVVQTRHPTLLKEGELQNADECILRPGDPAIQRAPGRSLYGAVRTTTISCTPSGTTLSSSAAFGTDVAAATVTSGSVKITKTGGFSTAAIGQTLVGTGIAAGTTITRVVSVDEIQLSTPATADGTVTVTFSDLHPGTFVSGTGISVVTSIVSITNASTLIVSVAISGSTTTTRTFSEAVSGLQALVFDNTDSDVLLAKAADKLYTSPLTTTFGTFSELAHGFSQNASAILDAIQYKNRHVLLTGYDPPRVIYYRDNDSNSRILVERALGLLPVKSLVGPAVIAGVWSSDPKLSEGFYYFLVTEVVIYGEGDEVEGTFIGTPKAAHITARASQAIKVTYTPTANTPVNDGLFGRNTATHWRVYMSTKQEQEFPRPDFADFVRMATIPITTGNVTLSVDNPHQSGYAAALQAVTNKDPLFPGSSTPALSQVAAQTLTATTVSGSTTLTSSAAFGSVTRGMVITSTSANIPFGTTVVDVPTTSSLTMSAPATGSGSETVGFGNKSTFDNSSAVSPQGGLTKYRSGIFYNFGIHNIGAFSTSVISGIKVEIQGSFQGVLQADPGLEVYLHKGDLSAGTESEGKKGTLGAVTSVRVRGFEGLSKSKGKLVLGDPFDTWGLGWIPSDFVNGTTTFGIRIRKNTSSGGDAIHYIDGVKVTIYGGATSLNYAGTPFRVITISDQLGNTFATGASGAPPVASTGDIFEGMLLLNDATDESSIIASLPDEEEAFPDVYRLPLESRDNDKVRVIRRLSNLVVIGCLNSIKRLNYFPRETDPEFNQGRCYEDIATDHGMVGPKAAVLLDIPGRGTVLAYLSHNGVYWTDGVTTQRLNEDLDWGNLIEPTLIQRSVLVVYSHLSLLALYYVPYGSTGKTKCIYFSYHPTHLKEGFKLPAVGPVSVESGSAVSTLLNGRSYLFTGHGWNGNTYLEDSGTTDGSSSTTPTMNIRTRRYFLADLGMEGRVERVLLVTDADGDATTGAFTASLYRQNQGEAVTASGTTTGNTVVGGIVELFTECFGETFDLSITKDPTQTADFRLHYLGYEAEPYSQDGN